MKYVKEIFLKDRTFYLLGGIIALFLAAFAWPLVMYIAWGAFALFILGLASDVYQLFRFWRPIQITRDIGKHFSLSDENPVLIKMESSFPQALKVRLIDEIPIQFQTRDFEIYEEIEPAEEKVIRYELRPVKRGEYWFGKLNAFISTSVGLMERRIQFDLDTMVKVYPSFIQMRAFELMVFSADRSQLGIKRIRKLGHGYEFSDIRNYVIGDDPRTINWKASSRTNKLMVNNYQDERSQQIYAVINKSRVMRMPFNGLSLMDYAINSTLALQNIVLQNQDHAGLIVFSGKSETFLRAERKFNQRQRLLDILYNINEDQLEGNYQALYETIKKNIRGRSMLMLFTNFMSLTSLHRVLPILKQINRSHLLTLIFFENTELEAYIESEPETLLDVSSNVLAARLSNELTQVVYELRNAGIQAIQSKPEDLTANSINKYLELKSRGMI